MNKNCLLPRWPVASRVKALVTTRRGGVSHSPYDSMNLALHVGDAEDAVHCNRSRLAAMLPAHPFWLNQVHGIDVVEAAGDVAAWRVPQADASVTTQPGVVCAVLTADCLPVLFADASGQRVGAVHAGWRGLAGGILEATIARLGEAQQLLVWLGPAIGPEVFEVEADVRDAFLAEQSELAAAFRPGAREGKWLADIFQLARMRLRAAGVTRIFGGGVCCYSCPEHFYSWRRDGGRTGRFASMIWIE